MRVMKRGFDNLEESFVIRADMAEDFPESENFREYFEDLTWQLQYESVNPEEIDLSDIYEM